MAIRMLDDCEIDVVSGAAILPGLGPAAISVIDEANGTAGIGGVATSMGNATSTLGIVSMALGQFAAANGVGVNGGLVYIP